jgi:pyruvate,water dikinase
MKLFIKNLNQLGSQNVDCAGGKGASLGEMLKAGLPVPPGFVILASAFDQFLAKTDLNIEIDTCLSQVNYDDIYSVERASKKIRASLAAVEFPKDIFVQEVETKFKELKTERVAVRSSATAEDSSIASWAGELESYLNVTAEGLFDAIKKCWSSLYTPRALFYRFEKKLLNQKISVAVVVQKMIQAEVAGICFTVHPVTQDKQQLIIEAGYGLGEAVVSGSITPDSYVIRKTDWSILDENVAIQKKKIVQSIDGIKTVIVAKADQNKQKLTNDQIIELAKLAKQVEDHYGFPCDIEWALANGKFYLTQSRPITTL